MTFGLGGFLTFAFLVGLVFVFFGGGEMSMVYWKVWLSPRSVPKAEGVTPYIGKQGGAALKAIRPAEELLDKTTHRPSDCRPARSVGE